MLKPLSAVCLFAALAIFPIQNSHADVVAFYEFDAVEGEPQVDGFGNEGSSSTDTAAGIFSGFYSTRSKVFEGSTTDESGVGGDAADFQGFVSALNTPTSSSPVTDYYHEFAVTIVQDEWSLDSLELDYWVNSPPDGSQFTVTVYSDLTGTATTSDALGSFTHDLVEGASSERQTVSIDFKSGTGLEQVTVGNQVNFRLVFSDNQNIGFVHRVDDIKLNATQLQSVPEPTSAVAIGLLAMGYLSRRKR